MIETYFFNIMAGCGVLMVIIALVGLAVDKLETKMKLVSLIPYVIAILGFAVIAVYANWQTSLGVALVYEIPMLLREFINQTKRGKGPYQQ